MTRDHAQTYTPPRDPYASARCRCNHLVYRDDTPGEECRWVHIGGCTCTDHRPERPQGGAG